MLSKRYLTHNMQPSKIIICGLLRVYLVGSHALQSWVVEYLMMLMDFFLSFFFIFPLSLVVHLSFYFFLYFFAWLCYLLDYFEGLIRLSMFTWISTLVLILWFRMLGSLSSYRWYVCAVAGQIFEFGRHISYTNVL